MARWPEMTEADLEREWNTHWRWEWLLNHGWRMDAIRASYAAKSVEHLAGLLRRLDVQSILDCSCGLGLKTILLADEGFDICGSDISSIAVERAAELAKREGFKIEFRQAGWSAVPDVWGRNRFDCVFCDALSWTPNDAILRGSAIGFCGTLRPGGLLLWSGATKDSLERNGLTLALECCRSKPQSELSLACEFEGGSVVRMITRRVDGEGVLVRYAYAVLQAGEVSNEVAELPEPTCWSWNRMWGVLRAAGFRQPETVATVVNGEQRLHNVARRRDLVVQNSEA